MKPWRISARNSISNWKNFLVILLGCVSLLVYRVSLRAHNGQDIEWFIKIALFQSAIYLLAVWLVFRIKASRSTFLIVVIFATLFRLSLLFAPPYLSDDIYRYVWDGRVQAEGINPYRYVPANPELQELRDDAIYPKINRRDYAHTIYPPGAQIIFFLATRLSERVTWLKAVMICFEVIALGALISLLGSLNLPWQLIIVYAWHPLLVWEIAGSGHVEAAVIAFVALALLAYIRRWDTATGVFLAAATLIKFFPLLLFPALYRRWGWKMPAALAITIAAAYLPYLSVGLKGVFGFLPGYAVEEGLQNGSQFYLLTLARKIFGEASLSTGSYWIFALLTLAALGAWTFWQRNSQNPNYLNPALVMATAFMVLLSPHYAWYFAWLIPLICLMPRLPLFYLTTACFVLYKLWHPTGARQLLLLNSIIYLPFAVLCLIVLVRRFANRKSPGSEIVTILENELA